MNDSHNGWDAWYEHWDRAYADQGEDSLLDIIPYTSLSSWGEEFCRYVTLNDHWTGYAHPGPMSLDDGMSIAFVLYDVGVNVDELLDLLSTFQPILEAPRDVSIPLCWLTEPMEHIHDLLEMLANISIITPDIMDEMQEVFEELSTEAPLDPAELPDLLRAMVTNAVQWLLEIVRVLGETGMIALRAWWQGRLITALRETVPPKRREWGRRRRPGRAEMPSAFRDLIQSLDYRGIGTDDEDDSEEDASSPHSPSGRY